MNSDGDIGTDRYSTESGSAGVLSNLRCCYYIECEVTRDHPSTSGGVSWYKSYSRALHWKSGVPVTPIGRITERVRVTVSPAMMLEGEEEVREMVAGTMRRCMLTPV